MTFKEKLVRLRKINSLTQDEFACAVGVSRQAVYKWESGQSYPEVAKLLEIKLLFGISIDDLLDDTYDIPLPQKKRKKRMTKAQKEELAKAEALAAEATAEETAKETAPISEVASPAENSEAQSEKTAQKKGLFGLFSRK